MMPTPNIEITARPAQQIVSRHAEAFCSTPAQNIRTWWPTDIDMLLTTGSASLRSIWMPSNYPYGKSDYILYPDSSLWVEGEGSLGSGDKSVGFAGSATVPPTTNWSAILDTEHTIDRNRGVVLSFIWYRPADDTVPNLKFYPRVETNRYAIYGGIKVYFSPFYLQIDGQMNLNVFEYPYDNYDAFYTNPLGVMQKTFTYPLQMSAGALNSRWYSIFFEPISDSDVYISGDIMKGGGFVYRSALDRQTISLLPQAVAGIVSGAGGTGQVQITPMETKATGNLISPVYSKLQEDIRYPILKVFGWSPALIETDKGYMENQTIDAVTGTGGISYEVYTAVVDPITNVETNSLILPNSEVPFQDFRVKTILEATDHISPVLQDIIVDYDNDTGTVVEEAVDISADTMLVSGQVSNDGSSRFNLKIRNRDNVYNAMAERIMTEVDVDIDGEDFVVLYTLNPSYNWFETPTQGALQLDWECGDGMVYLERELCARMPAYDGQLLSSALTEFMGRLGYDASRLDIDTTDGTIGGKAIRLPRKRGKENYQFKPEDGTPAVDFIKQLKEWFGPTHTCRFVRDGKFQFKYVPVNEYGVETPVVSRIYYPKSTYRPDPDDHLIYRDAKVELMMNQFYNEIWVVGEDKRNKKPLVAVYQDLPSQSDKNAANYVGRRLLMIVLTKCNTLDSVTGICNRLVSFYNRYGVRLTFNTRLDPVLQKDDFIQLYGVAATWRVVDINYDMQPSTVAHSAINSTTPVIKGMSITAVQWPVA